MQLSKEQLLVDLFDAYYDARKHKRNKSSALAFELDYEKHLIELCDDIVTRKYKVGRSACFIVTRPVKREIFAAEFKDRVVHHLIFNYVAPLFERTFIDDSYSCRVGRGTSYGISRMHYHMKSCTDNFTKTAYVLKLDIQGYFMNINRQRLFDKVMTTLTAFAQRKVYPSKSQKWSDRLDYGVLEYLLREVIFNDPTVNFTAKGSVRDWDGLPVNKSLFGTPRDCGLPIGNLTSQLFSNIYLTDFDHYCKRVLKLKHYGRYVDDFMIIHSDKSYLESLVPHLSEVLQSQFALNLHPKKVYLQHYTKGVTFLGVVIRGATLYPAKRIRKAAYEALRVANNASRGWVTFDAERIPKFAELFIPKMNSYLGLMQHYDNAAFREKIICQMSPYLRQWVLPCRRSLVVRCDMDGGKAYLRVPSAPYKVCFAVEGLLPIATAGC